MFSPACVLALLNLCAYSACQSPEVVSSTLRRRKMRTDSTVGATQFEHGFPALVRHRHETPVVLDQRKAVWVVLDTVERLFVFIEHFAMECAWNSLHPTFIRLGRLVESHGVRHDNVAKRQHVAGRHWNFRDRILGKTLLPTFTPRPKFWPKVAKALQGVEVGRERDYDVVGGNQRCPVDGPEVWPQIDENDVGIVFFRRALNNAPECRGDAKGTLVPIQTLCPDTGKVTQ